MDGTATDRGPGAAPALRSQHLLDLLIELPAVERDGRRITFRSPGDAPPTG